MTKNKFSFAILFLLSVLTQSCQAFKKNLFIEGSSDEAVSNAIYDFTRKKGSQANRIFLVTCKDSVFTYSLKRYADGTSSWEKSSSIPYLVAVGIFPQLEKILVPSDSAGQAMVLSKISIIERNGKTFIFKHQRNNSNAAFIRTNLEKLGALAIVNSELLPSISTNEQLEETQYFFCRSNLRKYKKQISSRPIGLGSIPQVKCQKK